MAFQYTGESALDYFPCRYGKSKLLFRGPRRRLDVPFVAAVGGTETYGKFVAQPWPELLERKLGMQVVNFGYLNAGVDVFLHEPQIIEASEAAQLTVVQLIKKLPHPRDPRQLQFLLQRFEPVRSPVHQRIKHMACKVKLGKVDIVKYRLHQIGSPQKAVIPARMNSIKAV